MKRGHVYFLETEDQAFVKIGYSAQVAVRMSELGTFRPGNFRVRLLGSVPGTIEMESWIHQRFAVDRDNGEWFKKSPRLTAFIESLSLEKPKIVEARHRRACVKSQSLHVHVDGPKDPHAVAMGRKRARALSPERRKEIAQEAARARWDKEKERREHAT